MGALLGDDPRLCTTDGLIRTGCDPPLEMLEVPPEDRPAVWLVDGATPLLLPLNRCQPPAVDCGAAGVEGLGDTPTEPGPRAPILGVLPICAGMRVTGAERVIACRC